MRKALLIDLFALEGFDLSLALGYLKAFVDADPELQDAWETEIVHHPVETPVDELAASIMRAEPDLVGFSCFSWNIRAVEGVVGKLSSREKKPFVVLGGVEVSPDPMGALRRNRNVEAVIFGEGEETFRGLLMALKETGPDLAPREAEKIKGLAWRDGKSVHANGERPPIQDLGAVPSPYLEGSFGDRLEGHKRAMVETTRGCHYRCAYCYESRGFKEVRAFPLDRAREELTLLARAGVREVLFLDTNFNQDAGRAKAILDHLESLGARTRYAFELRAETLSPEVIRGVASLDFFAEIGLQTTNPKAIEAVNRVYDPRKFEANVRSLLEASLYRPCSFSAGGGVTIDIMVGLPHDRVPDIMATFDAVFALAPSKIAVSMTKILPGTPLYDQAKKYRYKFDPDAQYQVQSNRFLSRKDVATLLHFRDAVDFAYNRVHAVRTIGWLAEDLKTKPSAVFMEMGRQMSKGEKPASAYTVKDLSELLASFAESRGSVRVAESSGSKLTAESLLNVLQKMKEKRRTWWAKLVFGLGRRFLSLVWGLPPLPR